MEGTLKKLFAAVALFGLAHGAEPQSWKNVSMNPGPSTITTTVYSEKTVYVPVTTEKVVPTTVITTVYQVTPTTVTTTLLQASPTTITTTVYSAAPTTIASVRTESTTVYLTTTVYATAINTVTNVDTKYQTNTATSVQYATVTITDTVPTTVVAPCTTSSPSPTGLVLCPSRIVNPTYTPPTPLPSNYLWGCPPGYICQPKQENCNFEQDLPAKTYFCSPDQCKKAGPLPPLEEIKALQNRGPTCAWLTPTEGYFELDPRPWGLTYAIFNIFGQPTCPALPLPSSTSTTTATWATWSPPPPPPPSSSTQWKSWGESSKPSEPPSRSSSTSAAWQDWQGWQSTSAAASHVESWTSKVTPRAVLQKRTDLFPGSCYQFCDYAVKVWQSVGNDAAQLCPANGAFSSALGALTSCSLASVGADTLLVGATKLDDAKSVCGNSSPATARMLKPRDASSSTTLTAAEQVTGTVTSPAVSSPTTSGAAQTSSAKAAAKATREVSGFMTMLFSFWALFLNI